MRSCPSLIPRTGFLGDGVDVADHALQLLEGGRLVLALVLQLQGAARLSRETVGEQGQSSQTKQLPISQYPPTLLASKTHTPRTG